MLALSLGAVRIVVPLPWPPPHPRRVVPRVRILVLGSLGSSSSSAPWPILTTRSVLSNVQLRGSFDFRQMTEWASDYATDIRRRRADADITAVVSLYDRFRALTETLNALRAARNDNAS